MLVDGQMTPVAVVNPGPLSELQQEGLLDAVSTYLNAPAVHYRIATVSLGPGGAENSANLPSGLPSALGSVTLPGLVISAQDGSNSPGALVIPPGTSRPFMSESRQGSDREGDPSIRRDEDPAVGDVEGGAAWQAAGGLITRQYGAILNRAQVSNLRHKLKPALHGH